MLSLSPLTVPQASAEAAEGVVPLALAIAATMTTIRVAVTAMVTGTATAGTARTGTRDGMKGARREVRVK